MLLTLNQPFLSHIAITINLSCLPFKNIYHKTNTPLSRLSPSLMLLIQDKVFNLVSNFTVWTKFPSYPICQMVSSFGVHLAHVLLPSPRLVSLAFNQHVP